MQAKLLPPPRNFFFYANKISESSYYIQITLTVFIVPIILLDPMKWTSKHVAQWLEWSMQEFGLDAIDMSKFQLPGSQLLSLSKEEFLERAPPFTGDVLYAHLKLLQARSGKHAYVHCAMHYYSCAHASFLYTA